MPAEEFRVTFQGKRRELEREGVPTLLVLRETLNYVADEFEVSAKAAGYRALNLKLIDKDELHPK